MTAIIIRGLGAETLDDLVTYHFSVRELTHGRGWWPGDPKGEVARYQRLADLTLEVARRILDCAMIGTSGARFAPDGRPSSMHFPPIQREHAELRFLERDPADRGAALDFVPHLMRCDDAFHILDAAQRRGRLPKGGLFWYPPTAANPGATTGRFLHIDNRGEIAREHDLTPPRRIAA